LKKVLIYSGLLVLGLVLSQTLPGALGAGAGLYAHAVKFLTMVGLGFIMIHVGYEFDVDKSRLRSYGWDATVATTAAVFPWLLCCLYFVLVVMPAEARANAGVWKESLVASLFSAPTSAGVLFSMLAAAGLATTWVFAKARILAIFDDLVTVLLMVPVKVMMVGARWQLAVVVVMIVAQLVLAYKLLHTLRLRMTWGWTLAYAALIAAVSEAVHYATGLIDAEMPIHIEVLLPAFVLGCVIARQRADGTPLGPADSHHDDVLEQPAEKLATTVVSGAFMVLVGLSMPMFIDQIGAAPAGAPGAQAVADAAGAHSGPQLGHWLRELTPAMGWGPIILHVLAITLVSNLGKMFPAFCYRRETTLRQRIALAIGMWPRGEVGAGVLVVSLGYGIGGPIVVIALLSLALNLCLTGVFIIFIKKILASDPTLQPAPAH
jgi:Kef-type K+ transport system membrane component KefB